MRDPYPPSKSPKFGDVEPPAEPARRPGHILRHVGKGGCTNPKLRAEPDFARSMAQAAFRARKGEA